MLSYLWNTLLYEPLVNLMAVLVSVVPGADVGLAIIALTLLVKLALYPFSQAAINSQARMALLNPELQKIKSSGLSKEEQAKKTFDLYKEHKVNPFSGCLSQIPVLLVIFALYQVFYKGVDFDPATLYSFVHAPAYVNMLFLGLIDISQRSFLLSALAGVSQYLQGYFMPPPAASGAAPGSFSESFGKSMNMQMKYFFPFFIFGILYFLPASPAGSSAVALYFITSNLFTVGQQIYVDKKLKVKS